jgi:thioredoxin 1
MLIHVPYLGCGPCRQIKPMYEELSGKYSDVAFGLVDVDDNPDASMEFQINSVPTFVSFDGETIVERFSGADPTKLESIVKDLQGR